MTSFDLPFAAERDVAGARVVFGSGAASRLPGELRALGGRRVYAITTGGTSATLLSLPDLLGDLLAGTYDAARQHVPHATIDEALNRFHAVGADACVALGGGSAIGLGKAVARRTGVPLVAVPTTYSGSEMTSIWGETDEHGKRTGRDPLARPRVVIYDVLLTLGLPAPISAASGMNAMAHAVEATYAANATDDVRAQATGAAAAIARSLPRAVANGGDLGARTEALAGAHLAGCALQSAAMGLHHRICHVLGGTFGLPHAETHAVVLPHVVTFNAPAAPEAMLRLSEAVGDADVGEALARLNRSLGITYALRELGLREADVARAAEEVTAKPYANPRDASRDDVRAVLAAAL